MNQTNAVYIEYCINCNAHAWCTKHDEAKYKTVFQQARQEIEDTFDDLSVYPNVGPYDRKPINPRLGAFEIIFRGTVSAFSKILFNNTRSGVWPSMEIVNSRIRAVMEGREFDEINPSNEKSKMLPREQSRQKMNAIGGNRHRHNKSYVPDLSQRSFVNSGLRAEKSMLLGSNIDSDEGPNLPKIKQNKRDVTPARLEGLNKAPARLEPLTHHTKLFRVDKDNQKVFRLVNSNNQYYFSQRKLEALDQPSPGSNSTENSYYGIGKKNAKRSYDDGAGSGNQIIGSIHDGYLEDNSHNNNEHQILNIKENRIPYRDGYHAVQRPQLVSRQQANNNQDSEVDATVFSQKSHITDDNEDNLASPVKRVDFHLENKRSNQEIVKRSGTISAANSIGSKQNSIYRKLDSYERYPSHKDLDGKFKLDLRRLTFPDEKISQVKVSKNRIIKKKITALADENEDCTIGIYSNTPEILALDSNEIHVIQGSSFKIPLKFEYQHGEDDNQRHYIFVLKHGRPWQKIVIEVTYTES